VAVASAGPYASLHLAPDRYHTSTPHAGCPSCHPTNSVKALKATTVAVIVILYSLLTVVRIYTIAVKSCVICAQF